MRKFTKFRASWVKVFSETFALHFFPNTQFAKADIVVLRSLTQSSCHVSRHVSLREVVNLCLYTRSSLLDRDLFSYKDSKGLAGS